MKKLNDSHALAVLEERIAFGEKEYSGVAANYLDALQVATDALRDRIDGGWISVKNGLPEPFTDVLLYTPREKRLLTPVHEGYYTGREFVLEKLAPDKSAQVTHWRPLPAPPSEEGK